MPMEPDKVHIFLVDEGLRRRSIAFAIEFVDGVVRGRQPMVESQPPMSARVLMGAVTFLKFF